MQSTDYPDNIQFFDRPTDLKITSKKEDRNVEKTHCFKCNIDGKFLSKLLLGG